MAEVKAHISGTVWRIDVAVGDEVAEGDSIVTLESMKMEMPVETEEGGKVIELKVEEGQFVDEDEVIAIVE